MPLSMTHLQLAKRITVRCKAVSSITAVAIGGSLATGQGGPQSDLDLYLYTTRTLTLDERRALTAPHTRQWQPVDYWGPGEMAFDAETGLELDFVYFDQGWMTEQIERVLRRHEAAMGYTTAFWHTVRHGQILFDRDGWLTGLQAQAHGPYPEALRRAIIALNYPLLRDIIPSYRRQIVSALSREDRVSVNHRLTALLASYFDVIFAVNRQTHPGEKRQLRLAETLCTSLPVGMRADLEEVLALGGQGDSGLPSVLDRCLDRLRDWLQAERCLP